MTRDPGWRRQQFAGAGTRRSERGFAADHSPLAETPSEIPARGWKDMLPRVYARITQCRVIAVAAGVSFYALLAIFPAIAALISIYGLFADPATMASHLDSISSFVPGGAIEVIRDEMHRVAAQGARTLGLALAAIVFLLLALAVVAVVPVALQYIGLESATERVLKIARWPLLFVTVSLALSVLYRYGPGRDEPRRRWITWGGVIAALLWIAISLLFSWYAANFGSYNKTYGSLGAVIAFMTWIWLSTIVILVGATIDAAMERQTVRDGTATASKPMGRRGAAIADTVGGVQG